MVQGGPVVQVGVIVLAILGLWVGARLLIDSAVRLARRFGLSDLVIGLILPAVSPSRISAPRGAECLEIVTAGSIKVIPIAESLVHRDGLALLASTLVGAIVVFDLTITRLEGAILAGLFVTYTVYLLRAERASATDTEGVPTDATPVTRAVTERVAFRGRDVLFLVGGLALVLVSGDYMVVAASALARGAGISEWVIGGTIVAAGTSTPEFAVSLVAIRRGSLGVSVGNVVGSNIYNLTGILGVSTLLRPLTVSGTALETLGWLVVVTVLVVVALWTRRELSRLEGALFTTSEIGRWILGILGLV